jgi:hypothetical protein
MKLSEKQRAWLAGPSLLSKGKKNLRFKGSAKSYTILQRSSDQCGTFNDLRGM